MSQRSNRWECRKRDNRQIGGDYDYMKMNIVDYGAFGRQDCQVPRQPEFNASGL
jgi:hypothetical protein